jgi:DNA-binding NtrC family response regulator
VSGWGYHLLVTPARILVIDDDPALGELIEVGLDRGRFSIERRTRPEEAYALLATEEFDVVLTDVRMRGLDGIELCSRIVTSHPDVAVIVMTAFGSLESAVAAIRAGAYDFITKPFELEVLDIALWRAVERRRLRAEVRRLRGAVAADGGFEGLYGESPVMRLLYDLIERVAASDAAVLIRGETGSGKELVARAIHRRSARRDGPFVAVNCAALPEALLESELFGHERGAFTGASQRRDGLFLRSHQGVLFLDEIGDMAPALQAKLLRAIQERTVRPVGGTEERPFDARILAATHRDLETAVEEGRFRQDLSFRLNVIGIEVPPLRARGRDVLLLAQRALEQVAARTGRAVVGLSPAVAERLLAYDWPGNVRELENCIERAVALTRHDEVVVDDLPQVIRSFRASQLVLPAEDPSQLLSMEEVERRYALTVLRAVHGNKTLAAKVLGFDRKTLYRKLERWLGEAPPDVTPGRSGPSSSAT